MFQGDQMYEVILSMKNIEEPISYTGFMTEKEALNFAKINVTLNQDVLLVRIKSDNPLYFDSDMKEMNESLYSITEKARKLRIFFGVVL